MSGSAFAVTHHAFSSGAGRTSDGNGSHASTLKSPSYTKSVSWQHYQNASPYTFNKYAEYADFTSDMLVYEKTYTAELSSIAGTPIEAGPFDTVVLFKINYN
ncbi:hypothetical protein GH770_03165 [Shigella dysenteriae]|nr:hypothetical protein GH770_03165 [Shigella dysenteriae]